MSRYRKPATIAAIAGGLLVGPVTSTIAETRRCVAPSGAKTIRADTHVIIYRKTLGTDPLNKRLAYWACLRRTGKRTRLTDGTPRVAELPTVNSSFRTSRRYVAYLQTSTRGTSQYYLFAYDLRRGRRLAGIDVTGLGVGGAVFGPDGRPSSRIVSLRVSDAGGLAWRTRGAQYPSALPDVDTITVFDHTGKRIVETAAPGTLSGPTLHGEVVRWRVAGAPRTYRLQT